MKLRVSMLSADCMIDALVDETYAIVKVVVPKPLFPAISFASALSVPFPAYDGLRLTPIMYDVGSAPCCMRVVTTGALL
ncbi:MAG: hypothetical protein ACD_39C00146G0001 [uncultured bacterium]|nr:MAG: hypothetical protein ACD_39C00146G0001 [uncultured bacterium]